MTPAQRVFEARNGHFSLGEMLRWAARAPHEVPLANGELFFINARSADAGCRGRMKMAKIEDNWPQ